MSQADTDETLMQAYGAGDADAFRRLYLRHADPVYRYCLRASGSTANAAEFAQDVWTRVIESRQRYTPTAGFKTWLYRIAHNRMVDHWRTQATRGGSETLADEQADPSASPERRAAAEDCVARLQVELAGLPFEQCELIVLREEGELTLEQMAGLQGVGRETVKSRLRYALAKLKEALHDCLE
ncbi:MAG: sigma-70 family RNA polymerase sigma factor [Gammaproteobacteria bacterium]|nr:sigma-70 family RNA polymerase sigma factor [Gammaproteobacteria bacterium]